MSLAFPPSAVCFTVCTTHSHVLCQICLFSLPYLEITWVGLYACGPFSTKQTLSDKWTLSVISVSCFIGHKNEFDCLSFRSRLCHCHFIGFFPPTTFTDMTSGERQEVHCASLCHCLIICMFMQPSAILNFKTNFHLSFNCFSRHAQYMYNYLYCSFYL